MDALSTDRPGFGMVIMHPKLCPCSLVPPKLPPLAAGDRVSREAAAYRAWAREVDREQFRCMTVDPLRRISEARAETFYTISQLPEVQYD